MTARELRQALFQLSEKAQDDHDIRIKVGNEYYRITGVVVGDPATMGKIDYKTPVILCSESDTSQISEADFSILVS